MEMALQKGMHRGGGIHKSGSFSVPLPTEDDWIELRRAAYLKRPRCPECNSLPISKGVSWLCPECGRWYKKIYRNNGRMMMEKEEFDALLKKPGKVTKKLMLRMTPEQLECFMRATVEEISESNKRMDIIMNRGKKRPD
jgi:hypothetical protein